MTLSERPTALLAQTISSILALRVRSRGLISTILRAALESHRDFFAVWCAWEPNALDGRDQTFPRIAGHDNTGRFVPYWHRSGETIQLETMVGYDRSGEGDWYSFVRRHGQVCQIDQPFLHPVAGQLHWITSEIAPIFEQGAFVGAVGIDWSSKPPARAAAVPPVVSLLSSSPSSDKLGRLTTREREVYYWVCQGKSNEEIAVILGISANTVKNHLSPIFQKLGVENRYAAALASRDADWLQPPAELRQVVRHLLD